MISGAIALLTMSVSSCSTTGETAASPSTTGTLRATSAPAERSTAPSTPRHTPPSSPRSSASASPKATAVKTFTPFGANGKPTVRIKATRTGYCWSGSIALATPNTYRCMAHNLIFDPCFAPSHHSGSVVCVEAPWATGTKLKLNRPLPTTHSAGKKNTAWAVELANGEKCVAITGMVQFVDDTPMRYGCGAKGGQAGDLRHDGDRWSVAYAAPHDTTPSRVGVATLWR